VKGYDGNKKKKKKKKNILGDFFTHSSGHPGPGLTLLAARIIAARPWLSELAWLTKIVCLCSLLFAALCNGVRTDSKKRKIIDCT
jgi:hypothetical protein